MRALAVLGLFGALACSEPAPEPQTRPRPRAEEPTPAVRPLPPSRLPAPARLVALGDVHGDLAAFRAALRLGGAIDAQDRWIGGALWVVQLGDVLDRGDDEPEILALIERLEREAQAAGGRFLALHGNHEVMNTALDFRYVTAEGFADFDARGTEASLALRAAVPARALGRAAAFTPGGHHARAFASRPVSVVVGSTVFVHGGITPRWAEDGLDALNEGARAFFLGRAPMPQALSAEDGPLWYRGYAGDTRPGRCAELEAALGRLGVARMVVGHTVQPEGITSACEGRVWRIDVGMARHYGGRIEVLAIEGDTVRALQ